MRPVHARLIGADALVTLDEARLVPALRGAVAEDHSNSDYEADRLNAQELHAPKPAAPLGVGTIGAAVAVAMEAANPSAPNRERVETRTGDFIVGQITTLTILSGGEFFAVVDLGPGSSADPSEHGHRADVRPTAAAVTCCV